LCVGREEKGGKEEGEGGLGLGEEGEEGGGGRESGRGREWEKWREREWREVQEERGEERGRSRWGGKRMKEGGLGGNEEEGKRK
jgi:hypothetical protein